MIRALSTTVALLAAGFAAIQLVPQAVGQTGPGWVTLTDGKTMGDWNSTGEANWRIEDGALVADKGKGGHLVTKNLQELPDQRRVLGGRGSQQRHLHPMQRSHCHRR